MTYTLTDFMRLGGPMMWPLLVCSVLTMAIIVERAIALGGSGRHAARFLDEVREAVTRRKVTEALAICDRAPGPLASMVRAGLSRHEQGRDAVRDGIEEAGAREIPRLERHLATLGAIAQVAPLFGLLGTTVGLLQCFHVMQVKAAALQPVGPADLSHGIWQALLATTAGLAIAIPATMGYNYFVRRVQQLVWEFQVAATDLLRLLAGEGPSP
ncbi:MAG: MotA/TolQ/ExbB proton channel family protein [Candidatus Omnitrophica bacterium]|nr:MotA/TolQ/ExbB proton channel family protein [Candidatus Omnitrophota bacterium]